MQLDFGYGNKVQSVEVPDGNLIAELHSNPIDHKFIGVEAIDFALQNPLGSKKLSEYNLSGKKIAVITSDVSRPLPS